MFPSFFKLRCWRVVFLWIATAALCAGADKKAAPRAEELAPAIKLSPFEVSAQSLKFEHWIKISSPHFVIYTDASKKEAAELLKHLEMVHFAAQYYLHRKSLTLAPVIIVLPTSRSDWRKIKSKGTVDWEVATSLHGSARQLLLVEYDWQEDGLESVWAMVGIQEVSAMNFEGPLWFWRGIGSFFGTISFKNDSLIIGKQGFDSAWIEAYGWMNWGKFFQVTSRSPEFTREGKEHSRFEGQCGVFVHYLLTNTEPVWTGRLLAWAAYLDAGNEPSEEAFKRVFQEDWKTWEKRLDSMLHGGAYSFGNLKFQPAAFNFPIVASDFPPREMRELFVLSQIMNQDIKGSDVALDSLLQHDLKAESLRELLADACESRRRPEDNLKQLRAIIASGSTNPAAFSKAATLLLHRQLPELTLEARLGDEVDEIRAWCKKALELEPLYVEANETLAWTEALAPIVDKSNLETIVGICRRLDGNASTDQALTALAVARWRHGDLKQAQSLCDRLNGAALSGKKAKAMATEIEARMNAAAVPLNDGDPLTPFGAGK